MSTRWPTHCLCAALLMFGMVTLSTGKPPDLPAADKVNCKDNPAVPEYGAEVVPAGAVELEESSETTPIDTFCPWLDALIRACEERAEVWFDDNTPRGLRAVSSHTVQVIDEENPPVKIDAPQVVVPTSTRPRVLKMKGVIRQVGWMGPETCSPSRDPVCRSVRACCACVNTAVARCAKQTRVFLQTNKPERYVAIYSCGPNWTLVKWQAVPNQNQTASSTCPLCRSFRACCGQVRCAIKVCVKEAQSCAKRDPSECAEPAASESTSPCPWMREKNTRPAAQVAAPVVPATPLDNLKKLEQARAMMKVAEQCQQAGKIEKARMIYARVRALVPGSRLDHVAEKKIEAMAGIKVIVEPVASGAEEEEKPEATPAPAKSDCPFILLKQKKVVVVPATSTGFPNALDNLQKLEQAQEMLENAENCVKEGMLDQAAALFRQIHLVCPGSPVDRRASEEGEVLGVKLAEARVILADALRLVLTQNYDQACDLYVKLEELLPNSIYAQIAAEHRSMIQYIGAAFRPAPEEQAESKPCCIEAQVAELLEECQRALTDGEYDKAKKLAKRAQKLDKDCVAANALVYKAHMLIQLREKQKQAERAKGCKVGACEPLCPHMPAIDPAVVRDIERALQIREETLARERAKKEAGQSEEAEPKAPPKDVEEDDPVNGSPQARARAASDCVASLLGIVHAGTGVEVTLAMDSVRLQYHPPVAVTGLVAAVESIQKATVLTPRVVIGEEDERATDRGEGVAP